MSDKESSASGASPSVAAGDSPQGASALPSAAGPITGVWIDELSDAAYDALDREEQLRRTAQPMMEEERPQDECLDGRGWTFKTIEHGGEFPDTMPQAILATDAQGRSCVYVYRRSK